MADGVALRINSETIDGEPDFGTPEYTAQHDRLFAAAGFTPGDGWSLVRQGRRPGQGLELSVSPDGLSYTVQPGVGVVNGPNSASGPYVFAIPEAVTKTLPAKPSSGTQRRDMIAVKVNDEDTTGTSQRDVEIKIVDSKTAAGFPPAPGVPTAAHAVGQLISTSTSVDVHPTNPTYTVSTGGILPVWSQAEENALFAYDGMMIHRLDTGVYRGRIGGEWVTIAGDDTGWTDPGAPGGGGWAQDATYPTRIRRIGSQAAIQGELDRRSDVIPFDPGFSSDLWTVDQQFWPSFPAEVLCNARQSGVRLRAQVGVSGVLSIHNVGSTALSPGFAVVFGGTWLTD